MPTGMPEEPKIPKICQYDIYALNQLWDECVASEIFHGEQMEEYEKARSDIRDAARRMYEAGTDWGEDLSYINKEILKDLQMATKEFKAEHGYCAGR